MKESIIMAGILTIMATGAVGLFGGSKDYSKLSSEEKKKEDKDRLNFLLIGVGFGATLIASPYIVEYFKEQHKVS